MGKTIVVTGGSGYIGTEVVKRLVARGDTVVALVRSDASAEKVEALGATALRGELTDAAVLTDAARTADAAINLAATNDEHGAAADLAAAEALLAGLGAGKPYLHTGGCWVWGNTDGLVDETAPLSPPQITAWRVANEEQVLASQAEGAHPVVVAPGLVYGHGGGLIPFLFVGEDEVHYLEEGAQHWSLVHVEDIADLYVLALDRAPAGATYVGVGGIATGREVAGALTEVDGLPDVASSISLADLRGKVGILADAFLLDQQLSSAKAASELGWQPARTDVRASIAAGD